MEPDKKNNDPLFPESKPTGATQETDHSPAPLSEDESAKKSVSLARKMGIGPFKKHIKPSNP